MRLLLDTQSFIFYVDRRTRSPLPLVLRWKTHPTTFS